MPRQLKLLHPATSSADPVGVRPDPSLRSDGDRAGSPLLLEDEPAGLQGVRRVSPDPLYRTDRYRLVTPYSLDPDPRRV